MRLSTLCRAALALLLAPAAALSAEDYWSYTYRNIDVTAEGSSEYAVNLARNCVRLDSFLSRILSTKSAYRMPTHIYAIPSAQMKRFTGSDEGAALRSSGYETTVVMDSTGGPSASRYWGAYFGYTATLLSSDQLLRGPSWYMVGVPSVFADTVFEHGRVKIGNVTPGFAYTLVTGGALIPMRTFLTMSQHDAELKGKHYLEIHDAEAWYLAREVFVESKHRPEFGKYLDLMRGGTAEAAAFSASFNISYEQLDQELVVAMRERAHVYIMDAPEDAPPGGEAAQRLKPAEVRGRFALLAARYQGGQDAVQLANEALQMDAVNESALRALALAQLAKRAYGESLNAIERLAAHSGSAGAYSDSGYVLAALTRAVAGGEVSLPLDAATLRQRAQQDYRRALAEDADDRRSRDEHAQLDQRP
jgi:hypothetical protein